jgi:hypothetical protein
MIEPIFFEDIILNDISDSYSAHFLLNGKKVISSMNCSNDSLHRDCELSILRKIPVMKAKVQLKDSLFSK